ncbi:MAG: hypothetical protein JL50_12635 [Peptococcaceae bacterium BICA1-7]|nr:MAG: hypothetical protein JL50_12635 [Peptococcaceae bacterium BICA1-7]HBV97078.1 hypothetical protein [Desulfotomaculum sp.]
MNFKSQKGMAMIPVLVIIFVASVLGVTVYAASGQELLNAQKDENKIQAYYFARSGVEIAIGLIMNGECDSMSEGDEKTYYGDLGGAFGEDETDNYTIKFIIGIDENDYIINSTGIVRTGVSGEAAQAQSSGLGFRINRQAIAAIADGGGGEGNIPLTLFADESLSLSGSPRISGNVATNAEAPGSVEFQYSCYLINGDLYIGPGANADEVVTFNGWHRGPDTNIPDGDILNLPSALNFPMPEFNSFPGDLENRGNIQTHHGNYVIGEQGTGGNDYNFGYYDSINIGGSSTVVIKLDGEDRIIRAGNLSITGNSNIVLEGDGKLYLYVENTFNLSGSSRVNYNGDPNSLVMFYQGADALNFSGNTRFSGNIFAQGADVNMTGSNNLTGNIITGGDDVSITGAADAFPRILYAPNADLAVTGSGEVQGVVVVNNCTVSGGSRDAIAAGSSLDTDFFDSLDWGENGPPSLLLNPQGQERTPDWRRIGSWTTP